MAMESARRLQRSVEEQTAKSAVKDPLSGEQMDLGAHDKTRDQIWQDEKEHAFFVEFLGDKDKRKAKLIIDNLASNKPLTTTQDDFLNSARKEFNIRRAETERLRTAFDVEHVRDIAAIDKNMATIVGKIGPEAARDLLMDQIEKLAFADDKKFKELSSHMKQAYQVAESPRARAVDNRVHAALERLNISEEAYFKAVESSMPLPTAVTGQTRQELTRLAKENMGTLMTIADLVSFNSVSRSRVKEALGVFGTQRDLLNQRNGHLKALGKVLNATITPDMRVAMQKVELDGADMPKVPDTNVDTVQDLRSAKDELSDEARKKRLAEALKAESKRLNKAPRHFDPAERSAFADSFADSEAAFQKTKKGRGLFMAILTALFKSKDDIKTQTLRLWP